ncbi:molybdopterin molybdotransferase MoeA [Hydrogenimonas sp.]
MKKSLIPFSEALEKALAHAPVTRKKETVMLGDALGRILAREILCRKNLPAFDNSAMDGFAIRAEDAGKTLPVQGRILAGEIPAEPLKPGYAYQIMTGAKMPEGADTVIPIEACEVTDGGVRIPEAVTKGANYRHKGEESRVGERLIEKGTRLDFSHIAMLSAQGIVAVEVYAPLRIAVLSSGDEIKEPWEEAGENEIYNANALGITALLRRHGFSPHYAGALPDDLSRSVDAIADLRGYDAIITTGGISMGEADYLKEAFVRNGLEPLFHGVDVKPGKPTMMGRMGETFVMAMPGNPLTTLVNTFLLCVPILTKMQGATACHFAPVLAPNAEPFKMKPTRANIVLGRLEAGRFVATRGNKVGSGMLSPLMESSGVALFCAGTPAPEAGETVRFIPFGLSPSATRNDAYNRREAGA